MTLALASGSGELSGNLTRAAIAGVVSFTDVAYAAAVDGEAFSLHAVDEGGTYADAVSGAVTSDVVATQLVFSTQPTGSVSGITLSTQPMVAAVDGDLTVDTDFTAPVTLTTSAPGSLVATPAAATAGQAVFVDVAYTATADGEAFTLEAEGGGLAGASLSAVSDVVATQLVFTTQPGRAYNDGPMLTQPVVTAQDSDHATDSDFTEAVTLAATVTTGGGVLSGGVTVDAAAGVAAFATVQYDVDTTGDTFFLTANDQDELGSDLPTVTSITLAGAETGFIVPLSAGYNLVSVGDASGSDPIAIVTLSLGANLVRALGFETPAINPNPPITGGKLYDPGLPAGVNTLQWTDPRLAYWLQVSEDDTLIIGGAMGKAMASAQPGSAEPPEHTVGSLHPVYDFMGIHGVLTVEGQPAPPGTTVEVVDTEGNLAGQVAVHHSGYYGFMPIYRDDPRSAVDEGADRGEWLHVRVNGLPTGEQVQWTAFGDVVELDLCVDTGTPGRSTTFPQSFSLLQNRPNPFNPTTALSYQLPGEELVSLAIYSLSGQMVRQLVLETQGAGTYSVVWDGRDDAHVPVGSGLYLCDLRAGGLRQARKLLLLK